jgi:hypothetical protein
LKLENSWKFNSEIWIRWMRFIQKLKMFHQLKWFVAFNKNLVTSMLVEKLTHVSRLRLCCGFNSTLSIILVGSWKHHFELKFFLQLEVTFSTSKCSWNVIETTVENLGFFPSVKCLAIILHHKSFSWSCNPFQVSSFKVYFM